MATTGKAWATETGGLIYAWRDDSKDSAPWQVRSELWDSGKYVGESIVPGTGNHRTPAAAEKEIARLAGDRGWREVTG